MKDSSPDGSPWEKKENANPSYINIIDWTLHQQPYFLELLDRYGIENADVTDEHNSGAYDEDRTVKVTYTGYPNDRNKKPIFTIYTSLPEGSINAKKLNSIRIRIIDMLRKFLEYPIDINILKNSKALNMTEDFTTDNEKKIFEFVQRQYKGRRMLQYESLDSRFTQESDDSQESRSFQLRAWLEMRSKMHRVLAWKKIVAYWLNNDHLLHLITELPDLEAEDVWEDAEIGSGQDVEMIVLEQSIHRILKENNLDDSVFVVGEDDDCINQVQPIENDEDEHTWESSYKKSPPQIIADINGRILNGEEDIKEIARLLREEVAEYGSLALMLVPSLEEDENWDEKYEDWQERTPVRQWWDIELYKLDPKKDK